MWRACSVSSFEKEMDFSDESRHLIKGDQKYWSYPLLHNKQYRDSDEKREPRDVVDIKYGDANFGGATGTCSLVLHVLIKVSDGRNKEAPVQGRREQRVNNDIVRSGGGSVRR